MAVCVMCVCLYQTWCRTLGSWKAFTSRPFQEVALRNNAVERAEVQRRLTGRRQALRGSDFVGRLFLLFIRKSDALKTTTTFSFSINRVHAPFLGVVTV